MDLEIGSSMYQLRRVSGPLRRGGKTCGSVCDHQTRRILISDSVPPEVRLEVAALAISEAWKRELFQRPPIRFAGDVS
jgi:hypothetical protein